MAYLLTWRSSVDSRRLFDLGWFGPAYMIFCSSEIGSLPVKIDTGN